MAAALSPDPESSQSWREVLGQVKRQGLSSAPKLAIGDGSLGFWIALQEEYGPIAQQRCSRAQDG
jgi:transposase-like protein